MTKIISAYQVFYMPKHLRQASKIDDMSATFAAQIMSALLLISQIELCRYGNSIVPLQRPSEKMIQKQNHKQTDSLKITFCQQPKRLAITYRRNT